LYDSRFAACLPRVGSLSTLVKFVKKSGMTFVQMENIGKFLAALQEHFAFKASDVFMTVDLYEAKNLGQVVNCLLMLKRIVGE